MDQAIFRSLCLLSILQLLLQLAFGQLTGSITSLDNQFIIYISISNPTSRTISVLNWNNVFDPVLQLPISFVVKDDLENTVQLASTYAMRAGMSDSDFYRLAPGQKFTRIFDLRQVMQNVPNGPSGKTPKTITVSLPVAFKGVSHTGSYTVPTAASADLTSLPPRLGDFSATGLQDITLTSRRLSLQLDFPIFQVDGAGDSSPHNGFVLDTNDCKVQDAQSMTDALFDAGVYAHSLLLAANDSSSPQFARYFAPPAQQAVTTVATSVQNAIKGPGPHVDMYCTDGQNICGSNSNILGYTFSPSWLGNAYIVLCPAARKLPRAPRPCSSIPVNQIGATASHVLFHLMLTLNNVVANTIGGNVYGSDDCQRLKSSLSFDATKNADSYAQVAIVQWAYGLGGSPYGGPPCVPTNGDGPTNRKRAPDTADGRLLGLSRPTRRSLATRQFAEAYTESRSLLLVDTVAGSQQCGGALRQYLQLVIENAQRLAVAARDNGRAGLFTTYFNGSPDIRNKVIRVFDNIAKWNPDSNKAGITIYCDSLRKTSQCKGGQTLWTRWASTGEAIIVLCPSFFLFPVALQCLDPSTVEPSHTERDQGGSFLHELTHIPWISGGLSVLDGFNQDGNSANCYNFQCATSYATNRNAAGVDPRNMPERNAANYELYAYAVRANKADCSWSAYPGSGFGARP
ncbi:MAG: hypothetical protein Q9225_007566 [Loekoesia sp. 1 TL-2023]